MWIDAFSAIDPNDYVDEVGSNKLSENAFSVIDTEDLASPMRSSAVAEYLHDDPQLFRNNDLDY